MRRAREGTLESGKRLEETNSSSSAKEAEYLSALGRKTGTKEIEMSERAMRNISGKF